MANNTTNKQKANNNTTTTAATPDLGALEAIATKIDKFLGLSVFGVLDKAPAVLTVDLFIVSKDNKSVFAGTESVFRANKDLVLDLVLPDLLIEPDIKTYPVSVEGMQAYMHDKDLFDLNGKPINNLITSTKQRIEHLKITALYAEYRRIVDFVSGFDPSAFVSNDPLKPEQLPQEIKDRVVSMLRASFAANPIIVGKGKVEIEVPKTPIDLLNKKGEKVGSFVPNLDSLNNVLTLIQWRSEYHYSQYGFYSKDLYLQIMQSVYKDLNCWETCNNLAAMLDVDFGSSKNTSTILESIAKHLM